MKLTEMKDGMEIRVSNNLDMTTTTWSVTTEMKKMKGGIYQVRRVGETYVSVYDNVGDAWTFSPEDLSIPKITPPPPPVMFDIKNIIE